MEFYVMSRTNNTYGGHPSLSLVSDFLLEYAGNFGTAVSELSVTFHFASSGPPRRTLEAMYASFHANRGSLPKVVFRRKRGQVDIQIASEILDGNDREGARRLSLPVFQAAVAETIAALALLRKRLKPQDDFQLEAFLAHCAHAQSRLPSTDEELVALANECKRRQSERLAAKSPWELLDIDWRDFHSDARQILDDPFYWDCVNEFAPHGNDTGADLLEDYRRWIRRNPLGDPIEFYHHLIRRWGFPAEASNDIERTAMDKAAVALAFAEFKHRADCRPEVSTLACMAVERQRRQAIEAVDWPHRAERLKTLNMLEAKLTASDRVE